MSKFSGAQGKGAAKRLREQRRKEAEFRFSESLHSSEGRRARHGELDPRRYQSRAGFASRKVQDDPQHHEEVILSDQRRTASDGAYLDHIGRTASVVSVVEELALDIFAGRNWKKEVKKVPCPKCGAGVDERCMSSTGRATDIIHVVRKQTAMGLVDN